MFANRSLFIAAALLLMAEPAAAQTSYPATIGSTPAPALGITSTITPTATRGFTLGIAAAATANEPAAQPKTTIAANNGPGRLRSSTR